jgi:replicative DNA helicase
MSTEYNLEQELPNNVDAERAILGAILLDSSGQAFEQTVGHLESDYFYLDSHRRIFLRCSELVACGKPIDYVTLTEQLGMHGEIEAVGGVIYVTSLTDSLPRVKNISQYIRIVRDKALLRGLIRQSNGNIAAAYEQEETAQTIIARALDGILGLQTGCTEEPSHVSDFGDQVIADLERCWDKPETIQRYSLGIDEITKRTGGLMAEEYAVVMGRTGDGKCLAKGTMVLMFDGSLRRVEDIRVGDLVMGPDSKPRSVSDLNSGISELFDVVPVKGESYRVNGKHILSLRKVGTNQAINITVHDWLKSSGRFKHTHKGYRVAVDFPERTVPVEPYYLGLWIGDGSTAKPCEISKPDHEIISYLRDYAFRLGLKLHTGPCEDGGCPSHSISTGQRGGVNNELLDRMRTIGFDSGKNAKVKTIPELYVVNSRDVRLKLLAGLLDSDGYLQPHGYFEITQQNHSIALQILFLARSLGFCATITPKKWKCQTGATGIASRVNITGDVSLIPTKVVRKQAKPRQQIKNVLHTGIKIESVGVGEYYGFELSGDGLFILGDFTVTHNTGWASQLSLENALAGRPVLFHTLELSKEILFLRMICQVAKVSNKVIIKKLEQPLRAERERIKLAKKIITEAPIFIDDTAPVNIGQLVAKSRQWKRRHCQDKEGLIVTDYIQKIPSKYKEMRDKMTEISEGHRKLAKEEKTRVIALSQMARPDRRNANQRPTKFDAKESGSIENDAHFVFSVYRPVDDHGFPTGADELLACKSRDGETWSEAVEYQGHVYTFVPRQSAP